MKGMVSKESVVLPLYESEENLAAKFLIFIYRIVKITKVVCFLGSSPM